MQDCHNLSVEIEGINPYRTALFIQYDYIFKYSTLTTTQ